MLLHLSPESTIKAYADYNRILKRIAKEKRIIFADVQNDWDGYFWIMEKSRLHLLSVPLRFCFFPSKIVFVSKHKITAKEGRLLLRMKSYHQNNIRQYN